MDCSSCVTRSGIISIERLAGNYQIRELMKPIGYDTIDAWSMNDSGVVVGSLKDQSGGTHVTRWNPDGTVTPDFANVAGYDSQWAVKINNSGQVLLSLYDSTTTVQCGYLLNSDGTGTNIGSLGGSAVPMSIPISMSDNGSWVVGYSDAAITDVRGFIWNKATGMDELDLPLWLGSCVRVNNVGMVAGTCWDAAENTAHAIKWNGTVSVDLSSGFGFDTHVRNINNSGDIVGFGYSLEHHYALRWLPDGRSMILGEGVAQSVNESGQVAGFLSHPSDTESVMGRIFCSAALWEADGELVELGSLPGFDQSWALDINNAGQILGIAYNSQTQESRPVVWQPVPEPSGILALIFGACGLGGMALRRR
jgi:uncharacterized membrane protein